MLKWRRPGKQNDMPQTGKTDEAIERYLEREYGEGEPLNKLAKTEGRHLKQRLAKIGKFKQDNERNSNYHHFYKATNFNNIFNEATTNYNEGSKFMTLEKFNKALYKFNIANDTLSALLTEVAMYVYINQYTVEGERSQMDFSPLLEMIDIPDEYRVYGGSRRKTRSNKSKKSTKRRRQNGRKSRKA